MLSTKGYRVPPLVVATASLGVIALLVLVPCAALFFAISPGSASQYLWFSKVPVTWWASWAVFSLWATLDSSRLLRAIGKPVDPLGTQALWSMLLGVLNIGTSLLVIVLQTRH